MSKYLTLLLCFTIVLFIYSTTRCSFEITIFSSTLFSSLVYASYIDLKKMEIPDLVSIGLFPVGALWVARTAPDLLVQRLLEAIFALLLFFLFNYLFRLVRKKEGLGFGDIKLIASSTVWIGLVNVPVMIFVAACSGLIASFYRFDKTVATNADTRIPFGPHLAASIWFVWFLTLFDMPNFEIPGLFR